jgi:phosphatidylinositol glycan class W
VGVQAPAGRRAVAEASDAPLPLPVLAAVNRRQLAVFLFANLLTGAVNLSLRTIYLPDAVGMAVVFAYVLCVCVFAVVYDGWMTAQGA